jgi:hypothetical protein
VDAREPPLLIRRVRPRRAGVQDVEVVPKRRLEGAAPLVHRHRVPRGRDMARQLGVVELVAAIEERARRQEARNA